MSVTADLELSAEQIAILRYSGGPLRIVAGAGSGKTEIMTRIVARLVGEGLARPQNILALTFTNKAAGSLQGRIQQGLRDRGLAGHDAVTASTFHEFCGALLPEYALQAGIERDFRLMPRAQVWQMMFGVFDTFSFEQVKLGAGVGEFIDKVTRLDSALKDELVSPERLTVYLREALAAGITSDSKAIGVMEQQLEMLPVVRRYAEEKARVNALDYGDLLALTVGLLREKVEVRREIQDRYRYILVDEYQDTNIVQKELVKLLSEPEKNLVVVGDPNQAIYTWRGATVYNIVRFDADFPAATTRTLMTNYRCDREILALAAAVARPLAASYDWDAEQQCRPDAAEGTVEAFVADCGPAEAAEIAERIEGLHEAAEPVAYADMAILYRGGKQLAALTRALEDRGIPFEVIGGGEFLKRPEIADIVAYLRLLARPDDNISLYRLLIGPRWKIGARDLACLARWRQEAVRAPAEGNRRGNQPAAVDALFALRSIPDLSAEARARLDRFAHELRRMMRLAEDVALSSLVRSILAECGVLNELEASSLSSAAQARAYLDHFTEMAHDFEGAQRRRGSQLRGFVDYLDVVFEAGDVDDDLPRITDDSVQIMTMHKVKGLQFDTVFVPGLAEGEFPIDRVRNPMLDPCAVPYPLRGDAGDLPDYAEEPDVFKEQLGAAAAAEERRLCYVAFTRARQRLILSRAHFYRENKGVVGPSIFWDEAMATGIPYLYRDAEQPDENPFLEWERPPAARQAAAPFPLDLLASPNLVTERARAVLPAEDLRRFLQRGSDLADVIGHLTIVEGTLRANPRLGAPDLQTMTALMVYETCPRQYYYTYVVPLPQERHRAAVVGVDIHRQIEDRLAGRPGFARATEVPVDTHPSEYVGAAPPVERLLEMFTTSRFNVRPHAAEQEFTLSFEHGYVRGRIDAIYGRPDGGWEIVDFKSGRPRPASEVEGWLQLPLYALAANRIWGKRARELAYTYFFLQDGAEITASVSDDTLRAVEDRVERLLAAIRDGRFDARRGCGCRVCRWIEGA